MGVILLATTKSALSDRSSNIYHDIREVREVHGLRLNAHHKILLYVIESRGKRAFPSRKVMAEDCGMSIRTVDRYLPQLEEADLVRVQRRTGQSSVYVMHPDAISVEAERLRQARKVREVEALEWDDIPARKSSTATTDTEAATQLKDDVGWWVTATAPADGETQPWSEHDSVQDEDLKKDLSRIFDVDDSDSFPATQWQTPSWDIEW